MGEAEGTASPTPHPASGQGTRQGARSTAEGGWVVVATTQHMSQLSLPAPPHSLPHAPHLPISRGEHLLCRQAEPGAMCKCCPGSSKWLRLQAAHSLSEPSISSYYWHTDTYLAPRAAPRSTEANSLPASHLIPLVCLPNSDDTLPC